jgi:hypothetical protein
LTHHRIVIVGTGPAREFDEAAYALGPATTDEVPLALAA